MHSARHQCRVQRRLQLLPTVAASHCGQPPPVSPQPCCCAHRLPQDTDPRHIDYTVSAAQAAPFYAAIRAYLPTLPDGALQPDYSGVRPKVRRAKGGGDQGSRQAGRQAGSDAWGDHQHPPAACPAASRAGCRPRPAGGRLYCGRAPAAWHRRGGLPVRHRVPGADQRPAACTAGSRAAEGGASMMAAPAAGGAHAQTGSPQPGPSCAVAMQSLPCLLSPALITRQANRQ